MRQLTAMFSLVILGSANCASRDLDSTATPPSAPCGEEFGACTESGCCANPGFDCYKKPTKDYAQCLRKKPDCIDSDDWLCPGWQHCTSAFGDCRASLCCQRSDFQCVRRPHMYYAQCRPQAASIADGGQCADSNDWLCPGWEVCAAAHGECTQSRCCADSSFGCYLNETLYESGGGWHAFCHQHMANGTSVGKAGSAHHSKSGSGASHSIGSAPPPMAAATKLASVQLSQIMSNFTSLLRASPKLCEGQSKERCQQIAHAVRAFPAVTRALVHPDKCTCTCSGTCAGTCAGTGMCMG